jgi:hypothetical protein
MRADLFVSRAVKLLQYHHHLILTPAHAHTYIHIYIHRDSLVANGIQKAHTPKTRSSISHNDKRAGTGEGEGDGDEVTEQDDAAHVSMPGVRRRKNVLKSGE